MSKDTCKVLVEQIEAVKRYQTGLRELIAQLAELIDTRGNVLYLAKCIRYTRYAVLGAASALASAGMLAAKSLLGKIIMTLGGIAGGGAVCGEAYGENQLKDADLRRVQEMIDEAEREFLAAERRIRELRREYRELGCDVTLGRTP